MVTHCARRRKQSQNDWRKLNLYRTWKCINLSENAGTDNNKSDIDLLSVKSIIVNQGMRLKRMKPRARGRADRIIKPTCHIEIILAEGDK